MLKVYIILIFYSVCKTCGEGFPSVDEVKHHVIDKHLSDLVEVGNNKPL